MDWPTRGSECYLTRAKRISVDPLPRVGVGVVDLQDGFLHDDLLSEAAIGLQV